MSTMWGTEHQIKESVKKMYVAASLKAIRFKTGNPKLTKDEGEKAFRAIINETIKPKEVISVKQKEMPNSFDDVLYQIEYK
jgi:hypothetical protein